jgi:NADPH:quinone reductase-like Zn-dependent oxidoreductase
MTIRRLWQKLISSSEVGRRLEQHKNVIDAAQAAGVRHVVYTSAPKATTTSLILAPEHKATEEYLVASGLAYTVVRNNWYTENYLQQLPVVQQTGVLVAAAGQGRIASATRADYAAGAAAVLVGTGHAGRVYELGGDYAWSYDELAAAMSEVVGRPVVYQAVDGAAYIEILKGAGLDAGTAGFVAALDANIAAGVLAETTGDLARLIGRPTTGLVAGLGGRTMRVVALPEFGAAPEVRTVAAPAPAAGEVSVRVRAASVNGFDVSVAQSYLKGMMEHRFPVVLGKDFAGTVAAVGPEVTGYAVGDRVFGVVTKPYLGDGSFGEYVTVPVAVGLARLPETVSFAEGAALGLAGTAAVMAVDGAALQAGSTVLIVGATGGVGMQALQLAAQAGAHVIATAHADDEKQQVTALGAAEIVDYRQDVTAAVLAAHPHGVDAVIHLASDPTALLPVVRQGGRFVSTRIMSPEQLPSEAATVVAIYAIPTEEVLNRLAANQAQGRTRVAIQRTYRLEEAPAALQDFAAGTLGKLVIAVD